MKTSKLICIFSFYILMGCQDLFECVVNRHPKLPSKILQTGFVGNYYFESFDAEIRNEPRDNDYEYYFNITGDWPLGIDIYVDYRTVIIEGIPEETGNFVIEVYLEAEQSPYYCESNFNDCDGLCEQDTFRTYVLTVN